MRINPDTGEKICSRCRKTKTAVDFSVDNRRSDRLNTACRECDNERTLRYRQANRGDPAYRKRRSTINAKWYKGHVAAKLWYNCKVRARAKHLPFAIVKDDIRIPDVCPVCAREIVCAAGENGKSANSPSVDRYDPRLGYTPDNIWVICDRCNARKQDMTGEGHIAFGRQLIAAREKTLMAVT